MEKNEELWNENVFHKRNMYPSKWGILMNEKNILHKNEFQRMLIPWMVKVLKQWNKFVASTVDANFNNNEPN